MGNNNATAILTEEESSKLETNGMSPMGSVPLETTQDQVFLVGEVRDRDKEKESPKLETNGMSPLGTVSLETTQDQVFLVGEVRNRDKEKESPKLEINGMSPLGTVSLETTQDQVFLVGEVRNGDKEKESSKLETNGMSPLGTVSLETTQDQVFLVGEVRDEDKEKESSKLETNGMSPLGSVSLVTTQNQVILAGKVRDGDTEKESSKLELETSGMSSLDSISVETTHNGEEVGERENFHVSVKEAEIQRKEIVDELKVKMVEEIHLSDSESLIMVNAEQLQKQTSVAEGVELVCEATEVAELSVIGTQRVVRKLNITESGNEEKLCVIDETVFVSPSFCETVGTEENMANVSLEEETVLSEEVVKLDQENAAEESILGNEVFPEMESQKFLKLDHGVVDNDEVTNEGKAHRAIFNLVSQEPNVIKETGRVYMEEKNVELEREASMKRMARCRSLPVSHSSRVIGDSLVQQLVLEVTFPSRTKMGLEKAKTAETLLTPCEGSNKAQDITEARTESSREAIEMRSPSFGGEQRIEERSNESTEKTPLLCQEKTEIYKTTINVEEKTVMLKRSESVKPGGIEKSIEFLKKDNNSFKETNGSGDNLLERKSSSDSMKDIVRKRSKSLLLGTCLCCTSTMN